MSGLQVVQDLLRNQTLLTDLTLIAFLLLLFLMKIKKDEKKYLRSLMDLSKKEKRKKTKNRENIQFVVSLRKKLKQYYRYQRKNDRTETMLYVIFGIELAMFFFFLFNHKFPLAIIFPIIFHLFILKALDIMTLNIHSMIERDLPRAIRHFIKVLSKTNDLRIVFYETSKILSSPLKDIFFDISRRMVVEPYNKVLMETSEELQDTWFYSFTFLILNFKEDSKKEDVIESLRVLADMIQKENDLREKSIIEKQSVIILNVVLAIVSVVLFVLNFIFNKYSAQFFFHTLLGMSALIIGYISILGTILVILLYKYPTTRSLSNS